MTSHGPILLFAFLGCGASAWAASAPVDVPNVLNQIASIEYEKSVPKAVSLLEQLESFDHWSMGGGRGPTDRTSLSMMVLVAARPFLPWDVKPQEVPEIRSARLLTWLRTEPQSVASMLEMLGSDDPLPRWIALTKLRATGAGGDVVLGKVQELATADGCFVITRQSAATLEGSEHIFDVPLRQMAIEILKAADRPAALLDYNAIGRQGLRWLGEHYLLRRSDRVAEMGIVGALRQLAPKTPEIVAAQAALAGARTPEAVLAVFENLIQGKTAAPEPRRAVEHPASPGPPTKQVVAEPARQGELLVKNGPQPAAEINPLISWKLGLLILGLIAATVLVLRRRR